MTRRLAPVYVEGLVIRVLGLALLLSACAGGGQAAPQSSAPGSRAAVGPPEGLLRDAAWGKLRVASRALELELPELDDWSYDAGKSWVRLEHAASSSRIELWVARAERLARPADCEGRARLSHPALFRPSPETTLEERTLDLSGGFRTALTVGISAESRESKVTGHAVAFGAAVSRCLAIHFVTTARGARAELDVAHRLALVTERTIPSIRIRGVEERIQTER